LEKSSSILELRRPARCTKAPVREQQIGPLRSAALFLLFAAALIALHAPLLRLPYFWDEAGYYIPAARDLFAGSLIPYSTPSNAHPPLVLAWIALAWRIFGESPMVTRCAMLLCAAFSLLGFSRLARTVSNSTVAAASTLLVAIYPVFFAQSSLAQIDLPAAGLTFWALEAYFRRRTGAMVLWFSLAALAKETAILVPVALFIWQLLRTRLRLEREGPGPSRGPGQFLMRSGESTKWLLVAIIPLALWYGFHYARTGFVFGNPEFFRYNVQGTLHPLRIILALLLRLWQTTGYLGLYILTLACFLAMKVSPQAVTRTGVSAPHDHTVPNRGIAEDRRPKVDDAAQLRSRIPIPVQLAFLTVSVVYLLALSVVGGAVLARYMLPIVPLWILICVSTIWRRLRPWRAVLAIAALAFIASIFVNPPYGFSPEDNLAYCDYIHLHQQAEAFLAARYPAASVLTAWPASDELSQPYLGYVSTPIRVAKIEDFTAEQLLSAADARSHFNVALVFSTKYQPPNSFFDHWHFWREWKSRYFGYHKDLTPEAAASVLGGKLVYIERQKGQWVGVVEMNAIEDTVAKSPRRLLFFSL
jgi:4-amino-4-deoxy-L-arabinose transferase-like glycosyltransferase